MKTKLDFITNSSSSSFIIASKTKSEKNKKVRIPARITFEYDLGKLVDVEISTIKKLDDELGYIKDENEEKYKKLEDTINNGGVVYILAAVDDGDIEEAYICENGLSENVELPSNIEIIEGEGGY